MTFPQPADWTRAAACLGEDPDAFFPEDKRDDIRRTKNLCLHTCPVRRECLTDVLTYEAATPLYGRHGIWAGLTPAERHKLGGAA